MKVPIGINKASGEIVLIEDISKENKGLACNCICPHCKTDLVARFCNDNKINHFSHHGRKSTPGCKESLLHIYGKYVLSKLKNFRLNQQQYGGRQFEDMLGNQHIVEPLIIFGNRNIEFKNTTIEKKINNIKGDVFVKAVYANLPLDINFEIKVSNKVNEEKKQKIVKLNVNTIEIDISHLLNKSYVNYNLIKKELLNLNNHRNVHIDPTFISKLRCEYDKRTPTIESINNRIQNWLINFEEKLVINGLTLPNYEYNLLDFPQKFQKELKQQYPLIFEPSKNNKVVSFKHINLDHFELVLQFKNGCKTLLVIMETEHDSIFFSPPLESYLVITNPFVEPYIDVEFSWGRNKKAHALEKACNEEITRLIKNDEKQQERDFFHYQRLCKEAIKSGLINETSNYKTLKSNSEQQYRELTSNWYTYEFLESILIDEIDNCCIFGIESRVWQIHLIHALLNSDKTLVDIRDIDTELESIDISLVTPYKEYMDYFKLLPIDKQKPIFDVPRTIFKNYMKALCEVGILIPFDEHRYIIKKNHNHPI